MKLETINLKQDKQGWFQGKRKHTCQLTIIIFLAKPTIKVIETSKTDMATGYNMSLMQRFECLTPKR